MSSEACHISSLTLLSCVKKLPTGTVSLTVCTALTAEYCNVGHPLLQHVFNKASLISLSLRRQLAVTCWNANVQLTCKTYCKVWHYLQRLQSKNVSCFRSFNHNPHMLSGFGGLEVACWPLVPKFAGSNPAEAVGFFRAKKSSARLPSEGK